MNACMLVYVKTHSKYIKFDRKKLPDVKPNGKLAEQTWQCDGNKALEFTNKRTRAHTMAAKSSRTVLSIPRSIRLNVCVRARIGVYVGLLCLPLSGQEEVSRKVVAVCVCVQILETNLTSTKPDGAARIRGDNEFGSLGHNCCPNTIDHLQSGSGRQRSKCVLRPSKSRQSHPQKDAIGNEIDRHIGDDPAERNEHRLACRWPICQSNIEWKRAFRTYGWPHWPVQWPCQVYSERCAAEPIAYADETETRFECRVGQSWVATNSHLTIVECRCWCRCGDGGAGGLDGWIADVHDVGRNHWG